MNVFFTYLSTIPLNPWENVFLPMVHAHFARHPDGPYRLVDHPGGAEIIVALESNSFRTHRDVDAMCREPLLRDFPEQVFTVNYEDFPPGFLPGLYAALPSGRFDPTRHHAWCYLFTDDARAQLTRPVPEVADAALLFSFRGAESSRLRTRFFQLDLPAGCRGHITKINRWFDHDAQEKSDYFDEIANSKFVLCPYGQGITSRRLFEVMEMGRCPVIFGDDWVPPSEIDWAQCSIRLTDADAERLPEIPHRPGVGCPRAGSSCQSGVGTLFLARAQIRSLAGCDGASARCPPAWLPRTRPAAALAFAGVSPAQRLDAGTTVGPQGARPV